MAIMVTDPRNNLLSQLTAVGQQYLAGKQQERMSATEFSNKKALIELMDRLGGANDNREFTQQKELAQLTADLQAGLLTKEGEQRLAELALTTGSAEKIAETQGRAAVGVAGANRPPRISIADVQALVAALNGPTPTATAPSAPSNPFASDPIMSAPGYQPQPTLGDINSGQLERSDRGFNFFPQAMPSDRPTGQGFALAALTGGGNTVGGDSLTREVEKAFVDIGGPEDLAAVMTDDLETLKALKVKYSDLPWYKSNRNTETSLQYLNAKIDKLSKKAKSEEAKAQRLGDLMGGVQIMRSLQGL